MRFYVFLCDDNHLFSVFVWLLILINVSKKITVAKCIFVSNLYLFYIFNVSEVYLSQSHPNLTNIALHYSAIVETFY